MCGGKDALIVSMCDDFGHFSFFLGERANGRANNKVPMNAIFVDAASKP